MANWINNVRLLEGISINCCLYITVLGNILQIVSAPGQQIIRPQGSMVMQTMPQAVPASNASATPGTPHPALSTAQQGDLSITNLYKISSPVWCNVALVLALLFQIDWLCLSINVIHLFLSTRCDNKCHSSPHQAHYCSSSWFTGRYIAFKLNQAFYRIHTAFCSKASLFTVTFRSLQKKRLSRWSSVWAASLKQMSDVVAAECCMGQTCCRHALWAQSLVTLHWLLEAGGGWVERAASGPREPVLQPRLLFSPLCSLLRIDSRLPAAWSRGTSAQY